jgi:hypothetical protein
VFPASFFTNKRHPHLQTHRCRCHDSFGFSMEVVTRCFLLLPGPFLKWCMIFSDCSLSAPQISRTAFTTAIYSQGGCRLTFTIDCSLSTFTMLLAFLYFSRRLLATAHVRSITLPRDGVAATESDSHDSAGSGMSPLMSVMRGDSEEGSRTRTYFFGPSTVTVSRILINNGYFINGECSIA